MKNIVFNNYEKSIYSHWLHYYRSEEKFLLKNEEVVDFIKNNIREKIKTIVMFGSANGRDFIPFGKNYNLIGFDIPPAEIINWVCDTENLTYNQCSMQDFLNLENFDIDWENCLVYSQGTLMYLTQDEQNLLIDKIINFGCKNIVLHEYDENSGIFPYLKLNNINEKKFERKLFRPKRHGHPIAHIMME